MPFGLLLGTCAEPTKTPITNAPTKARAVQPPAPNPAPTAIRSACDFETVLSAIPSGPDNDEIPIGVWTDWRTDVCMLEEFDFQDAVAALASAGKPYDQPIRLPSVAGRQLFIVRDASSYIVLVDLKPNRYRACVLGLQNGFGSVTYQLCHPPGTTLLAVTSAYGRMGAGRGASGSATTYLKLYDLKQDHWLLHTTVGRTETSFGYEDEQGHEVSGKNQDVSRYHRLFN